MGLRWTNIKPTTSQKEQNQNHYNLQISFKDTRLSTYSQTWRELTIDKERETQSSWGGRCIASLHKHPSSMLHWNNEKSLKNPLGISIILPPSLEATKKRRNLGFGTGLCIQHSGSRILFWLQTPFTESSNFQTTIAVLMLVATSGAWAACNGHVPTDLYDVRFVFFPYGGFRRDGNRSELLFSDVECYHSVLHDDKARIVFR